MEVSYKSIQVKNIMRWKLPYIDSSASRCIDFFGSSMAHVNRISKFCYFICEFMEKWFLSKQIVAYTYGIFPLSIY